MDKSPEYNVREPLLISQQTVSLTLQKVIQYTRSHQVHYQRRELRNESGRDIIQDPHKFAATRLLRKEHR